MSRSTPWALNRPRLIWNRFPPKALTFTFVLVAIGIMTPIPKLLIAVLAAAALWAIAYFGKDPISLLIWIRAFFQCAEYEPTRRKIFRLEIK